MMKSVSAGSIPRVFSTKSFASTLLTKRQSSSSVA